MKTNGVIFTDFLSVQVARDLQNISGTFLLECIDQVRLKQALAALLDPPPGAVVLDAGQKIEIAIDGETVLIGWIDRLHLFWDGNTIHCRIDGRDKTGDLVDCSLPELPAEFRGIDLLAVAKKVCERFGIPVKADVDVGAPFDKLSRHPHETALAFLEKAARQRAVLLTSDGVGGLLLTQGGKTRAPAPLRIGENMADVEFDRDWTRRFSDYYVVGQTSRKHRGTPAFDADSTPDTTVPDDEPGTDSDAEGKTILMTGHAVDPEVKRWRPTVLTTRTQSGMSTTQEQAEWALRVARGQSEGLRISALDWRDGPRNELWRPNARCAVFEPYSGTNRDMLIAGVRYAYTADGSRTQLRLVGLTAYDRINESERQRGRRGARTQHDSTNTALKPRPGSN